jgi:hypothetical protein
MKRTTSSARESSAPSNVDGRRSSRRPTIPAGTDASSGVRVPRARPLLARVPIVALETTELLTRALDHRSGFFVSQIDGTSNVETLLDLCPFPRDEALRLLDELVESGIVVLL